MKLLLLLSILFAGGGTAAVATAQYAVPGDTLYPVKEQVDHAIKAVFNVDAGIQVEADSAAEADIIGTTAARLEEAASSAASVIVNGAANLHSGPAESAATANGSSSATATTEASVTSEAELEVSGGAEAHGDAAAAAGLIDF